jgi:hypothetical protein
MLLVPISYAMVSSVGGNGVEESFDIITFNWNLTAHCGDDFILT